MNNDTVQKKTFWRLKGLTGFEFKKFIQFQKTERAYDNKLGCWFKIRE